MKNYVKIYTEEFGSEEESEGKVEAENGTPSQLLNFSYEGIDAADFETVINKDAYVKTEIQVKIKYFYKRILDLLIQGYYEEALSRVRIAMKQGGVLKAILWHQGEADCSNPEAYKQKLISLVKDLREDLGMPNLPVIVGQISQWNWTKREAGTVPFNQMIKKVSSFIPHSDWVSSKGLGWYKDEKDPHFNTEAQLLLGKRYAKKVLKFYKHQ